VKRFVQVRGCTTCKIEVPDAGSCCPVCGAPFDGCGGIILDLVLQEKFVPCKVVWYRPSTWSGGRWIRESTPQNIKEEKQANA